MSAWRVGSEAVPALTVPTQSLARGGRRGRDPAGGGGGGQDPASGGGGGQTGDEKATQTVIDRVTKWIPGDVLALYATAVTAFSAGTNASPSVILLIVSIFFAGLVVLGSAFSSNGSITRHVWLPAGLAAGAFAIWSLSVPFSGWQKWHVVHDNQAAVAVVAAAAALLYTFLAEGLSKRFAPKTA
jgi:hypothetical protein